MLSARTHRGLAGLTLTRNRRQRDPIERKEVELCRADQRPQALRTWSRGGRVGTIDTMARLIDDWADARQPYRTGTPEAVHELANVPMLAGLDQLTLAARTVRREQVEIIDADRTHRIAGGHSIDLAVGDRVRVRRNDYPSNATGPLPYELHPAESQGLNEVSSTDSGRLRCNSHR